MPPTQLAWQDLRTRATSRWCKRVAGAAAVVVICHAAAARATSYTLEKIAPPPGAKATFAGRLNARGQVTGPTDATSRHGYLWTAGTTVALDPLPGHTESTGRGLNDAGDVVGSSEAVGEA